VAIIKRHKVIEWSAAISVEVLGTEVGERLSLDHQLFESFSGRFPVETYG